MESKIGISQQKIKINCFIFIYVLIFLQESSTSHSHILHPSDGSVRPDQHSFLHHALPRRDIGIKSCRSHFRQQALRSVRLDYTRLCRPFHFRSSERNPPDFLETILLGGLLRTDAGAADYDPGAEDDAHAVGVDHGRLWESFLQPMCM